MAGYNQDMPEESVQFSQKKHHSKSITALVISVIIFGVVLASYITQQSVDQSVTPVAEHASPTPQEQLISALRSSSEVSLSNDQKSQVITRLKRSNATLSDEQKNAIISSLKEN